MRGADSAYYDLLRQKRATIEMELDALERLQGIELPPAKAAAASKRIKRTERLLSELRRVQMSMSVLLSKQAHFAGGDESKHDDPDVIIPDTQIDHEYADSRAKGVFLSDMFAFLTM